MPPKRILRILSWNVNGLRACARKGFRDWLRQSRGDIVGLQEVRALPEDLAPDLCRPPGWRVRFCPAKQRGYSGVALYARRPPNLVEAGLGKPRFDREGRFQVARFGRLVVANVYFPKGSGTNRDNSRVPFKLDFCRAAFERVEKLRRSGYRVVVLGDFNTAHREIDLARPHQNRNASGFLPEEREELDRWIRAGWIDTFRRFKPGGGYYTWWSQRFGVREKNIGWRIDYVLASPSAMRFVRHAFIQDEVRGSDHAPVGIDVERGILGRSA